WWNEEVRAAMDDVMRFWLDRGVDGFRVDVAHGLVKDRDLRNNPRFRMFGWPRLRNWDLEEVHEIHRRWRKMIDAYPGDRMAVGEVDVRNLRRLVRYYGRDDELQLSFNFQFLEQPWQAEHFRAVVEQWERLLPAASWPDYTLSNHDRSRAATRYGLDRAGVAAVLLLTLRRGSYRTLPSPRGVYAYAREADGERVFVALNFTRVGQIVSLREGEARVLFSTDHRRDGERATLAHLALSPNESLVVAGR